MNEDTNKLKTIHEKDLEAALGKLNLLEKLRSGELKCKFCGTPITLANIYSVLPESGAFNLVCDKPECINSLIAYLDEKRRSEATLR